MFVDSHTLLPYKQCITVDTNKITITLTDLYLNPVDVGSNLSGFWFTTSVTPTTDSITSSSATAINVAGNGTYTNVGATTPGWALTLAGAVTKLDDLGAAGPAHTIIGAPNGSNVYSAGNGSIDGNGPHNDFLYGSATWTLAENGVTSATTISNVKFMFGTTENAGESSILTGTTVVAAPEPTTEAMFLGGLALIFAAKKYRRTNR